MIILLGIFSVIQAQAPQKMNYQAVIRDSGGELVTNGGIGMQVSILQGSPEGTAVYVERHFTTTNDNGLVSIHLGGGTVESGTMEEINWGEGPYFIHTETDLDGGTNYTLAHTSELISVPYALYAKTFDGYEDLLSRIEALEEALDIDDPEPGTVTDIDGNVYQTVIIGNQEWMAENLRVSRYNNGNAIPTGLSDGEWGSTTSGAYAIYNNSNDMLEAYGKLYNCYAVDDERGLCPEGWSIPGDDDWTALVNYVVSQGFPNSNVINGAGNALKSCRQVDSPLGGDCDTSEHPRWNSHGTHSGFDEFGFSALPGGSRYASGNYGSIGVLGYWWSSSEVSSANAWFRYVGSASGSVVRHIYDKRFGFSVRCFRSVDN